MSVPDGDPNVLCETAAEKIAEMFEAETSVDWYQDVTAYDYNPVDPRVLLDTTPCFVVDLNYPKPMLSQVMDQGARNVDYLLVKYYHNMGTNDAGGRDAARAVRGAVWRLGRLFNRRPSLWGLVHSSVVVARKVEDIAMESGEVVGIMARWGWVTVEYSVLAPPI